MALPALLCTVALATVTIDDLATRTQIVLAAISPDGGHAAYLLARGNPARDIYEMKLEVVQTQQHATPVRLASYELGGSDLFDGGESLRPGAGGLYWTTRNELLFTERPGAKMRLAAWTPDDSAPRTVIEGHDEILLDGEQVRTRDVIAPTSGAESGVRDYSWRMTDSDRFFGERPNVKTGPFVREQTWSIDPVRAGEVQERWLRQSPWPLVRPASISKPVQTQSELIYAYTSVASPSGSQSAFVRVRSSNRDRPGESKTDFGVAVARGDTETTLAAASPYSRVMLGWAAEKGPVYFIETRHEGAVIGSATLRGKVADVVGTAGQLETPCTMKHGQCQAMSADGRLALLIRSTNTTPDELVLVDLRQRKIEPLARPNAAFDSKQSPAVRFYSIDNLGGRAWGRLYLPTDYRAGVRYPLVISLYTSTPGFHASVGDELPVLALAANGIAVFAMNAGRLGPSSKTGDFRVELARVTEPTRGLEWIIDKLADEGIVDRSRVGVVGLSYGAEIAMYAYARTNLFAAVSSASGSWNPSLFALGGRDFARDLLEHGLTPVSDERGLKNWQELAVGFAARADLPPLLIQCADGEQLITAPSWTELRLADAPVEWYDYPEAESGHVKARPANKWWVYRRNLDWFRFWLQRYEDPDATKAEQYARWRRMRRAP